MKGFLTRSVLYFLNISELDIGPKLLNQKQDQGSQLSVTEILMPGSRVPDRESPFLLVDSSSWSPVLRRVLKPHSWLILKRLGRPVTSAMNFKGKHKEARGTYLPSLA